MLQSNRREVWLASVVRPPQLDALVNAAAGQQRLMRVSGNAIDDVIVCAQRRQQPPCMHNTRFSMRKSQPFCKAKPFHLRSPSGHLGQSPWFAAKSTAHMHT